MIIAVNPAIIERLKIMLGDFEVLFKVVFVGKG